MDTLFIRYGFLVDMPFILGLASLIIIDLIEKRHRKINVDGAKKLRRIKNILIPVTFIYMAACHFIPKYFAKKRFLDDLSITNMILITYDEKENIKISDSVVINNLRNAIKNSDWRGAHHSSPNYLCVLSFVVPGRDTRFYRLGQDSKVASEIWIDWVIPETETEDPDVSFEKCRVIYNIGQVRGNPFKTWITRQLKNSSETKKGGVSKDLE